MQVSQVFYQNHSLEPTSDELFILSDDMRFIFIHDKATHTITEILNVSHIHSMDLLPPREVSRCICEDQPNPDCKAH